MAKNISTIKTEDKERTGEDLETLAAVSEVMKNDKLTDQEQLFCLVYVRCFNVRKAYQRAFEEVDEKIAERKGRNLLNRKEVQAEVKKLKKLRFARAFVDEEDVLQKHIDIAFADITDFVEFRSNPNAGPDDSPNQILLKDSAFVDGTVVSEIRGSKTSFSIRMVDKQKSLDWLSQHYGQLDEERKARIEKLRAEVKQLNLADDGESGVVVIPAVLPPTEKKNGK